MRALNSLDRAWLPIAACLFAFFAVLNYHDFLTVHLDERFYWFAAFIRNGFSQPPGTTGLPTYPQWGYGWVLAVTTSRAALLALQIVLALGSVAFMMRYLERRRIMPVGGVRTLKILLLISVPWYAQHVVLWPNSHAVSLVLVALILLARSTESSQGSGTASDASKLTGPWACVIASGLLFGVALNFRPDFWLYPVGAAPAVMLFARARAAAALRSLVWIVIIAATLVPWMIYTHRACGHFVPTSTNSGHVAFAGLGGLPGNAWGITLDDHDPVMLKTVADHFGEPRSTFDYDTDQFLRREFLRRVRENPGEYAKKCFHTLRTAIVSGAYVAKFYRQSDDDPIDFSDLPVLQREFVYSPVEFVRTRGVGLLTRLLLTAVNDRLGKMFVMLGYVAVLPALAIAIRRRHVVVVLASLAIFYQTAIMAMLCMIPMYMSNIYLWHLLMIVYFSWNVHERLRARSDGGDATVVNKS